MDTTRRGMLKTVVTAAGAAVTNDLAHAQEQSHDHEHSHQAVPSDPALRVKSLESLLVEKGLVDPAALDVLVETYEHRVGPRHGAQVVARAWVDRFGRPTDVYRFDCIALTGERLEHLEDAFRPGWR